MSRTRSLIYWIAGGVSFAALLTALKDAQSAAHHGAGEKSFRKTPWRSSPASPCTIGS
jgi:hypothetical protein